MNVTKNTFLEVLKITEFTENLFLSPYRYLEFLVREYPTTELIILCQEVF